MCRARREAPIRHSSGARGCGAVDRWRTGISRSSPGLGRHSLSDRDRHADVYSERYGYPNSNFDPHSDSDAHRHSAADRDSGPDIDGDLESHGDLYSDVHIHAHTDRLADSIVDADDDVHSDLESDFDSDAAADTDREAGSLVQLCPELSRTGPDRRVLFHRLG